MTQKKPAKKKAAKKKAAPKKGAAKSAKKSGTKRAASKPTSGKARAKSAPKKAAAKRPGAKTPVAPESAAKKGAASTRGSGSSETVSKDRVVSIHYTVKDAGGQLLESSVGEEPLVYLHGHGNVIKGLERALNGKPVGFKSSFQLSPSEAYGDYNEKLVYALDPAEFADKPQVKIGTFLQLSLGDTEDDPVVVRVTKITDEAVVVDGNHPFAGKSLKFDVEIVDIRTATKEERAHGHAHVEGGCEH